MAVQEELVCTNRQAPPAWPKKAIFYQIFPDRFFNGDVCNDPPHTQPWGSKPEINNFFGGDLLGICSRIPYLKALGVNALYLNPIFKATTNHKYNTQDYLSIDPSFGNIEIFRKLVAELHQNDIRIILDGVFNHTGVHFWAFQDIMQKGAESKFLNWYYINSLPLCTSPPNYECWWDIGDLPKLNVTNPAVRNYLKRVIRYWTKQGIDGWRLDVPNEIEMSFWREFRDLVKNINPDAYLVGEIWHDGAPWLQGDQFDAVMNYRWRDLVINFLNNPELSPRAFEDGLKEIRNSHSWETNLVMLNLLGSHDTPRILTVLKGKVSLVKLAVLFQMTYPGTPCIYYGDEVGLWGEKDPDCRRTMPWDHSAQNIELLQFYQKAIKIRRDYSCFQEGAYVPLILDDQQEFFGFLRIGPLDSGLVLINPTHKALSVSLSRDIILEKAPQLRLMINLISEPHWQIDLQHQKKIDLTLKSDSGEVWLIT